jgi:hypothetical protein
VSAGRVGCDELEALAPELALGTLTGAERADAVGHLAGCADCQQRVSELAPVVDSMLLLAPEDDPSAELETRVLARTVGDRAEEPNGRRRISRRGTVLAACLTAAAAVLGVCTASLFDRGDRWDSVRTALAVEEGGRSICRAVINEAEPAWLFVSLDEPDESGADYIVELELEHGGSVRVGRIEVRDGHGVLAVTLDLDDVRARAVRLVGADEEVAYEAIFE